MSEFSAESVRRERRRKVDEIRRMGDGPSARVDASDYSPPGGVFSAMEKVGPVKAKRPAYRRGGKIAEMHGEKHEHKGRSPRKRADGGEVPTTRFQMSGNGGSWMDRAAGLKRGGEAKHADEAEDKALIRKEVKKDALKRKSGGQVAQRENIAQRPNALKRRMGDAAEEKHGIHCGCARCSGGNVASRKNGGSVSDGAEEGTRPVAGGRMARATGGRAKKAKGAMNVNIVIATGKDGQPQMGGALSGAPPISPMLPPRPLPPPMGAPGAPVGPPAGAPMPSPMMPPHP